MQRRTQSPWCGGHLKKGRRECSNGELRADVSAWLRKAVPAVCHPGIQPEAARMEEKSELQISPGDLNCPRGLGQGLAAHSGHICEQAPGQASRTQGRLWGHSHSLGGLHKPTALGSEHQDFSSALSSCQEWLSTGRGCSLQPSFAVSSTPIHKLSAPCSCPCGNVTLRQQPHPEHAVALGPSAVCSGHSDNT